ncbi:MAG: hypothetical protein CMH63_01595 [Nanoarchaeota archaeon]|jgi:glutaredoxin|nr:hypothetical protein [Nanoarchaeota archaeon]|tara:strand:+ start:4473 stop:4811 length:339 start_codon:yes stop_codon:yes gene_type:complete
MKKNLVMLSVVILIIAIILLITYLKPDNDTPTEAIDCIASQSELYVLKTCGHCATQKLILKEHLDKFNVIECSENRDLCKEKDITGVPTWIINGEKYSGKKSLKELKTLTEC